VRIIEPGEYGRAMLSIDEKEGTFSGEALCSKAERKISEQFVLKRPKIGEQSKALATCIHYLGCVLIPLR